MRKMKIPFRTAFFLGLWLIGLVGCADDPEQKASKQLRRAVQTALNNPDRQQARQQIQKAIRDYPEARSARPGAFWAQGGLVFDSAMTQAGWRQEKLAALNQSIDRLANLLSQLQSAQIEKERVAAMLAGYDAHAQELTALLNGQNGAPGLRKQLQDSDSRLAELKEKYDQLDQRRQRLLDQLAERQAQADQLQRQADLQQGDAQLTLRQQASQLLLEGREDYLAVQQAEYDLGILKSDIAIANAQRQAIQEGIANIQTRLEQLQNPQAAALLRQQIDELDAQSAKIRSSLFDTADQIKSALSAFTEWADKTIDEFRQAAELFQTASRSDISFSALMRQADSLTYAAVVCGQKLKTAQQTTQRLTALVGQTEGLGAAGLQERLPTAQRVSDEDLQTLVSLFDAAQEAYQQAVSESRRLKGVGQEAYLYAISSRLIALQIKMTLADDLKLYDLANQTQTQINELLAEANELGSAFTLSSTAQFLQKGLQFTPALPINLDLYFESIRPRFAEWKTLATPEQQAARVQSDLAEIDNLVKTYGDRMAQLFEPIRQEMLAAQQQGFRGAAPEQQAAPQESPEQTAQPPADMMMPMMPGMPIPQGQ